MANAYNYSNIAIQTALAGNISSGATSVTVGATTGFPALTPYVLAVDYGAATEELVVVTAVGGTTLTVTRGFGGTSAQSHSIGAVVRHVVNAQDLTDFRTHEAATAGVHGVTGSLVGTTQSQTLTNKTLTSPTINSGALSGTFTGNVTLSGAVALSGGGSLTGTFAGGPTFTGGPVFSTTAPQLTGATSGTTAMRVNASDEASDRFQMRADGYHEWGSGTGARDTTLYRSAAGTLKTDGDFIAAGDVTAVDLAVTNVATINTLNVTTVTPGSTTVSAASLLTAATGWSVTATSVAVLKAGMLTVNFNFTRTGADITTNNLGNMSTGIVQMGTVNSTYAPNSALGEMYTHAGNTSATGTARITAARSVDLVRWQASQTISTGNIIAMTLTYPL